MKQNSKNICNEIEDMFKRPPSVEQKAWGVINEFYHLILTYMERNDISQAELARRLNKSRSAISQMFMKSPNVSVKKMVEIADAVGIDINLISKEIADYQPVSNNVKFKKEYIFVPQLPAIMDCTNVNIGTFKRYKRDEATYLNITSENDFTYEPEINFDCEGV